MIKIVTDLAVIVKLQVLMAFLILLFRSQIQVEL